ncbi:MAG: DNA polymerase III subunit psi [Bacteroidota bacterium]
MNVLEASIFNEEIYVPLERTTVVLNKPWREVSAEEQDLLQKILLAVGLKPESVAVHYEAHHDFSHWQPLSPKSLYFGLPLVGYALLEIASLPNGTQLIPAPPLADLQKDSGAKQKLWQALKQLFKA